MNGQLDSIIRQGAMLPKEDSQIQNSQNQGLNNAETSHISSAEAAFDFYSPYLDRVNPNQQNQGNHQPWIYLPDENRYIPNYSADKQ